MLITHLVNDAHMLIHTPNNKMFVCYFAGILYQSSVKAQRIESSLCRYAPLHLFAPYLPNPNTHTHTNTHLHIHTHAHTQALRSAREVLDVNESVKERKHTTSKKENDTHPHTRSATQHSKENSIENKEETAKMIDVSSQSDIQLHQNDLHKSEHPTLYKSRARVLLVGLGADELLAGYGRHHV